MKILMLGDYSNLHACLAKELRKRQHEVTLVSDRGTFMHTDADIELRRRGGVIGSIAYLYNIMARLPEWTGYDVVQLINPSFLSLKPGKLRIIFDILKANNRSVFLTLCGNDHFFVKDCVETDIFRYSEFRIGKEPAPLIRAHPSREQGWLTAAHASYHQHVYDNIDGAMSVLPEYDMSARRHINAHKLTFTNLPIDLSQIRYTEMDPRGPVRILIGIKQNMEIQKGTAKLLEICKKIQTQMPRECEVRALSNLPLADYLQQIEQSHIVIDQLYSYSPATNALQAMAYGRIAASGAQPEYYSYTGEKTRPIFSLSPLEDDDTIRQRLTELIKDRQLMQKMGEEGRRLTEQHNDVVKIAPLFEAHWEKLMK